jgi:membrane protein DedA with SNARE-associated domain
MATLASLEGAFAAHGWLALLVLMMACPPLPSEVVLPLAGFEVASGRLNYATAVIAATAGALAHALAIYAIARTGSDALKRRIARRPRAARRLERLDSWFARYGKRVVLLGRMVSGARWLVGVPAGGCAMPLREYIPLTATGAAIWSAGLVGAGWAVGAAHDRVGGLVPAVTLGTAAVVGGMLYARSRFRP